MVEWIADEVSTHKSLPIEQSKDQSSTKIKYIYIIIIIMHL